MKKLPSIYVMVFLLLASLVFSYYEAVKPFYSLLLCNIRIKEVDKALVYFPRRQSVNILQMCIEINKVREDFSLTCIYYINDFPKYRC